MAQELLKRPLVPTSFQSQPEASPTLSSVFPRESPPSSSQADQSASGAQGRTTKLREAVEEGDVSVLRAMANEAGGYETNELRRMIWPMLLGCDIKGKQRETDHDLTVENLLPRDDERQVRLDIARSLINYPKGVTESERDVLRERLEKAILTVLRKHPALQYFQGYHDIVSILLLTLDDDDLLATTTEQMSLHRIRDSMGPGLEPTLGYLKIVHRLIQRIDPEMYSLVNQAASMPFFALSWALTLFSHDLYEVAVIARLFDFLLAHNPAMISYLVVAILLTKKSDLVDCLAEEDNDPAMVHSVLSQLPNIILSPSSALPVSPSSPTVKPDDYASEAESEPLFSSTSASTSTLSFDLSSSTSSAIDVSESLISLSEATSPILEPISTLRHRKPTRGDRLSFSSFDSDINALDDSMLTDPDIDNPAFSALPIRRSSPTPSPPTTPLRRSTSYSTSPGNDEFKRPPRTVDVEDLIRSALELWESYPLVVSNSACSIASIDASITSSDENSSNALGADKILGPKSCIFTYSASLDGSLSDVEAERICAEGIDIVHLEALLPDSITEEDEGEGEGEDYEDEEEEGFELVGSSPSDPKSKRRRRRSSKVPPSSINGRINLGPHGWLVVGGLAISTAVAYSVYNGRGNGTFAGLGTGGLGLRTAGGVTGVKPADLGESGGGILKSWAKGGSTEL